MRVLPHPSELTNDQALLLIGAFDQQTSCFDCEIIGANPGNRWRCNLPSLILANLIPEYYEPIPISGQAFLIGK